MSSWVQHQWQNWNEQSWQHGSWKDTASANEWRGWPRRGPARIRPEQLRGRSQSADSSEQAAQRKGKWRDPKHDWEDHEVLRCPWPGGIKTFPERPAPGCWQEVVADAMDQGLAQLLV